MARPRIRVAAYVIRNRPVPEDPRRPRRTTYFHLQTTALTADAWNHDVCGDGGDAGLTFACHFLPLPLKRPLADDQDAWLSGVDPRWSTLTDDRQASSKNGRGH
ncbi:hypothetical protein E1281_35520 [Actinomadura sp. KC345]|nr:hypothetical protein E1281_35520 [Actinomadura sp. KC345]